MKLAVLLSVASFLTLAQPSAATPTLDRIVLGSGGGTATNGTLRLDLTIGEAMTGVALGPGPTAQFGFWCTVVPAVLGLEEDAANLGGFAIQRSPNPFSTRTQIEFAIPAGSEVPVWLGVHDLNGRLVRVLVDQRRGSGRNKVEWDGRSDGGAPNPAGVYFITIRAGNFKATRKVVMVK